MEFQERFKDIIKDRSSFAVDIVYHRRIRPAYRLFQKVMSKYGPEYVMMLCPYAGMGDVYLAGLFIKAFAKKNSISQYVVAVIGSANCKVASLFGFDNVLPLSNEEADRLLRLSIFLGAESRRIIVMHHHSPQSYCGILENMRNQNRLNFTDMFLHNVFGLSFEDRHSPVFNFESKDIDTLFTEHSLVPGKTVVLAPYVNTLPSLPQWVWVDIAQRLQQRGYTVCTNCGGSAEQPVRGTLPLVFDFAIAVPVMERCGNFISVRSGFCDIVSSARCRKIIIYQSYPPWDHGTDYDYFSLNRMGLCSDAIELSCERREYLELIDKIMKHFEEIQNR